ncbi:IF-2-associated domain-containing protein, partial [Xanthomonas translucens]
MSQQTTIRKLAELVNTPVDKLLVQLAEAGMKFSGPDQVVTSTEKMKLLGFLRRTHGKTDKPVEEEAQAAPKKITLNRRKLQEVTVSAGRSKTTVNVEVRQKRTYVKTAEDLAAERAGMASGGRVDDERAEILRKLEASKQRNLAEQQKLAEQDRARAEEIQRKRQAEQDARDRVEAERKAALEAESAPPAAAATPVSAATPNAGTGAAAVPR